MNYGEVKAQFKGLFNRKDLNSNSSLVTVFLNQGLLRIQRELRGPINEKSVVPTIDEDYDGIAIPSDFLQLKSLLVDTDNDDIHDDELESEQLQRVLRLSQASGVPRKYCRHMGKWVLGPRPNTGDTIRIDYYAEFPALAGDSSENKLTRAAWDLWCAAACVAASTYYKDARKDAFEQDYQTILAGLQEQADQDELGGGAAVSPAYQYPEN